MAFTSSRRRVGSWATAASTARSRSACSIRVSGVGPVQATWSTKVSTGSSRLERRSTARHSRAAVVVSHPPRRSGSRTVPIRSSARSQVFCTASAVSACCSRNPATVARTRSPYRTTISPQARPSPSAAALTSSVTVRSLTISRISCPLHRLGTDARNKRPPADPSKPWPVPQSRRGQILRENGGARTPPEQEKSHHRPTGRSYLFVRASARSSCSGPS